MRLLNWRLGVEERFDDMVKRKSQMLSQSEIEHLKHIHAERAKELKTLSDYDHETYDTCENEFSTQYECSN